MNQLREIGNQLRQILSEIPDVIHTQADLAEVSPKLSLQVDEVAAQRVGLSNGAIAAQLSSQLDGITGGSISRRHRRVTRSSSGFPIKHEEI